MNNKILVLGGAGFLGQYITKELIKNNFNKVGCADISPIDIKGALTFQVDILNNNALDEVVKNYDIIINCTGQVTYPINGSLILNTKGIRNIVKSILKYNKKIVHMSSVSVFGTANFVDENTPLNPETPYAAIKAFSEFLITNYLPQKKFIILRLSNLFGKNQPKGIFSYLIKSYNTDKKLFFNNNGDLTRYYLHIGDCSRIISDLLQNRNISGMFNIRGQDKYSIKDLVHLFEKSANIHFNVNYELSKPLENIQNLSDKKIRSVLNINYQNSVEDFLKKEFQEIQRLKNKKT